MVGNYGWLLRLLILMAEQTMVQFATEVLA